MQIYPNAGHGFSGDTWLDAKARTLSFLQKYLANSAA
jgi:dipeptidyl aminopeptidase/acylaminoacyl peptidase